jgi:hypothetical protein
LVERLDVGVFFFEHEEHLLGQVFGGIARITGCREGDDPFAELGQYLVSMHGGIQE